MFQVSQGLLHSVGVSTRLLDRSVHTALESGAIGAKLTGAGGGGCMVVVPGDDARSVKEALGDIGAQVMDVGLDVNGVYLKEG
jgi:mevalonate kinase